MTELDASLAGLRAGLIDALRFAREVEREVLAGVDPAQRDRPAGDGGWSAKDTLAHLSAWRRHQTARLAARREGRDEPPLPATEMDDVNAIFHAEHADWAWERVAADAESTADALVAEVEAVSRETLADSRMVGLIMGDGPEHDLGHLGHLAATDALRARVVELADTTRAIIDRGGWPSRTAAYARYNLACFHALAGHLDVARSLLRQALPEWEELRTQAPKDDDLIALRDEIGTLALG